MNTWNAAEQAADLAAKVAAADIEPVAAAMRAMEPADAAAVGIFIGGYLSPGKRFLLVDSILAPGMHDKTEG